MEIGSDNRKPHKGWRGRLHEIIFEADTPAGKFFDIVLILSILTSVLVVMLNSVRSVGGPHGPLLYKLELFFTILFTIEYLLRLLCIGRTRYLDVSLLSSFVG